MGRRRGGAPPRPRCCDRSPRSPSPRWRSRRRRSPRMRSAWLGRAANAARDLNYIGTIVYQHGTARRDLAPRPSQRPRQRVREARQPRRAGARGHPQPGRGPLLLSRRQADSHRAAHVPQRVPVAVGAAAEGARPTTTTSRKAEAGRVAGLDAQAWVFEPKDGCASGTSSGSTPAPACCSRCASSTIAARSSSSSRSPTSPSAPRSTARWCDRHGRRRRPTGTCCSRRSATSIRATRAGSSAGCRRDSRRSSKASARCAASANRSSHLVYSDGLVAVSVFIEPVEATRPRPVGHSHQGSINVFVRPVDDRRRDRRSAKCPARRSARSPTRWPAAEFRCPRCRRNHSFATPPKRTST